MVQELEQRITNRCEILGMHDLQVHSYGASACFATVHCEVSAEEDILQIHDVIDDIEREVFKEMNINLVVHMDPVITTDERANALQQQVQGILAKLSDQIAIHDFRVIWNVEDKADRVIFDISVPFNFLYSDKELEEIITGRIKQLNDRYDVILVIDHEGILTDDE